MEMLGECTRKCRKVEARRTESLGKKYIAEKQSNGTWACHACALFSIGSAVLEGSSGYMEASLANTHTHNFQLSVLSNKVWLCAVVRTTTIHIQIRN
jgi:hypothetical protein